MSLVPAVTELILAELLYLQYDNPTRPVYMYINSAGVTVSSLPLIRLLPKMCSLVGHLELMHAFIFLHSGNH